MTNNQRLRLVRTCSRIMLDNHSRKPSYTVTHKGYSIKIDYCPKYESGTGRVIGIKTKNETSLDVLSVGIDGILFDWLKYCHNWVKTDLADTEALLIELKKEGVTER